jgi:hypothetical protein
MVLGNSGIWGDGKEDIYCEKKMPKSQKAEM